MAYIGIFLIVSFGAGLIGWFLFKMVSHEEHANYIEQYSTAPIQFKTDIEVALSGDEIEKEEFETHSSY